MIWLWWSWLILLVGSSVAFYKQHAEYLHINAHDLALTNRQKEEVALQIMAIIGQRFYANTTPISVTALVNSLHLPQQSIEQQLDLLVEHGLLVNIDQDELTYTPARPLEELTLKAVVDTVREPGPSSHIKTTLNTHFTAIQTVLRNVDKSLDQVLGNKTIKDLVNEFNADNDKLDDAAVTSIRKVER